MFWLKKLVFVAVALVVGAGVFALRTGSRGENTAQATESLHTPPAEDPDPLKQLEKRQAELEKQKAELEKQKQQLDAALENVKTEKQRLEAEQKKRAADAAAAAELANTITVSVGDPGKPRPYQIREVVNGREATMVCTDLDLLTKYLTRVRSDPKGAKKLAIHGNLTDPEHNLSPAILRDVCKACAAAGYETGVFWYSISVEGLGFRDAPWVHQTFQADPTNYWPGPGHIVELKKYADRWSPFPDGARY